MQLKGHHGMVERAVYGFVGASAIIGAVFAANGALASEGLPAGAVGNAPAVESCSPAAHVSFGDPVFTGASDNFDSVELEVEGIDAHPGEMKHHVSIVLRGTNGQVLGRVAGTATGSTFTGQAPSGIDLETIGSLSLSVTPSA